MTDNTILLGEREKLSDFPDLEEGQIQLFVHDGELYVRRHREKPKKVHTT